MICADLNMICAEKNMICAEKKVICADLNMIFAEKKVIATLFHVSFGVRWRQPPLSKARLRPALQSIAYIHDFVPCR